MSSDNKHRLLTGRTVSAMPPEDVKAGIQKLRDVIDDIGDRLSNVMKAVEGMEQITNCGAIEKNEKDGIQHIDKKRVQEIGKLREKEFQTRNSLLTDLFNENQHMRGVYNIWTVILFLLFLNTIFDDLITTGTMNSGISTIFSGFAQFPQVIKIWLLMTLSSFAVYAFHSFWAHQRLKFQPKSLALRIWDYTWLLSFIAYQLAFLFFPTEAVFLAQFPPPSTLVIMMEQVRMMMKVHAFVRSTSPRVTNYKPHTEGKEFTFPGFSKFLYFMFAPTLVYRDNYPRTKTIKWSFVVWHLLEFIFALFFIAFLYERFIFPTYYNYGIESITVHIFVQKLFNSMLPGIGMYLCGFYCLLHAWSNAWAELLKFGDRLFYKDWWNATSFDAFYRNWNVLVHDWLYTYFYKDFYEILFPGKKIIAMSAVFFTSALFHEYVLGIGFRLFYPMMFVIFGGFGYPLVWLTNKTSHIFGNIFLWFSLIVGSGILLSSYAMEYFARINCPGFGDEMMDLILPRSWLCNSTQLVIH